MKEVMLFTNSSKESKEAKELVAKFKTSNPEIKVYVCDSGVLAIRITSTPPQGLQSFSWGLLGVKCGLKEIIR